VYDRVHCASLNIEYNGAEKNSNNTGGYTVIDDAVTLIGLKAPSTSICSDSTCDLDAIDLTDLHLKYPRIRT